MRWIIFAALALAGCTTSVDEMSYSQLQQYATRMAEKCQEQGVPAEQMDACVEQEIRADQARRMKQRRIGAAISRASAEYGRNVQANRPVNCTSIGYGNMIRTTCY